MQLLLLNPAFEGLRVSYVSSDARSSEDVPAGSHAGTIPDVNMTTAARLLPCAWRMLVLVRRLRPRVIVSTGAGPGLVAVAVGSLLGARTVWVESLAGVTRLTVSGRVARRFVDRFVVQWPDLAVDGAEYHGNLL